jgi:hypothetical protein
LRFPSEGIFALEFDSADDVLNTPFVPANYTNIIMASRFRRTDANWGVVIGNVSTNAWVDGGLIFSRSVTGLAIASVGVFSETLSMGDSDPVAPLCLLRSTSATAFTARRNGVEVASATLTQVASATALSLGAETNAPADFFGGFMFPSIFIARSDGAALATIEANL